MSFIKVEPEDSFIEDEKNNGTINIPGSKETVLENPGNCVIAKVELVPPCQTDRTQNGFNIEEASHQSEEGGMEEITLHMTVEEDEFEEEMENEITSATKHEDLDLGEGGNGFNVWNPDRAILT